MPASKISFLIPIPCQSVFENCFPTDHAFSSLTAIRLKHICQSCCAAGMGSGYLNPISLRLRYSSIYHLMRHCIGKQNHQIRIAQFFPHISLFLCKNLCFTAIVLTDFLVLTDHAFISSDNDNDFITRVI